MHYRTRSLLLISPLFFLLIFTRSAPILIAQTDPATPNILIIIADDLGVDYTNGYHQRDLMPFTPTLDSLRSTGITFENVWSTPKCTPTRAAMLSGKYGTKTGVTGTPGNLNLSHTSLFTALANQTNDLYADALIGKWHLSQPASADAPIDHGADYYTGTLGAMVEDYYAWQKAEDGAISIETEYVTSYLTDAAINWVEDQTQPWLLWMAHVAPHSPFHEPPSYMYSINNTQSNSGKYIAMIESIDYATKQLLNSIPDSVEENTLIIYLGDNGTPNGQLQDYPSAHGKNSVYQGGIRVPLIISGAGVSRQGERESALIHAADIYATVLEATGAELPGGIYNSLSFDHLLSNSEGPTRDYNYSELTNSGAYSWTVRNQQYKLIEFEDGTQEFYDLWADSLEFNDLLPEGLNSDQIAIKEDLEQEAAQIQAAWSCRDYIQNGDETGIDCGGTYCAPCVTSTEEIIKEIIHVYPNPGSRQLTITSDQIIEEILFFNTLGKIVLQQQDLHDTQVNFSLENLSNQVYFIQVKVGQQKQVLKFIKQ